MRAYLRKLGEETKMLYKVQRKPWEKGQTQDK
jgi:hypothetical protein